MRLRLTQLLATMAVLRRITSPAPITVAAVGLVVVMTSSGDGVVLGRVRIVISFIVAASIALLDDTAAITLASSPVALLTRRLFRCAAIAALVGGCWSLIVGVAALRTDALPTSALGREVVALLAVAVVGSLLAQRWSDDGRGASAGGLAAIGWLCLGFVPRIGWVPLPPNTLDPGTTVQVTLICVVLAATALALSRDPASRWPS